MSADKPKNLIQIHVSQLKLGMFVADLDCGWLGTPFWVQGILVENQGDIDSISEYANFVWIDPLKQAANRPHSLKTIQPVAKQQTSSAVKTSLAPEMAIPLKRQVKIYSKTTLATNEQPVALQLYRKGQATVQSMLQAVYSGNNFDIAQARSLVTGCMESILRNPDALLWMSRIREQDSYTAEHCLNVAVLAMVFGRFLGLSEKDLVRLGLCGLLHDLGKMRVDMALLNKAGSLTKEEFDEIKMHALFGYELLAESGHNLSSVVLETARSHHERIDGRGYPKGVPAATLPDMVRIITIVDAYDAMTADRCYSSGKSNTDALKIIYENRGKQFDEELSLEFIRCIGIYPAGSIVELMNGCVAVVIEVNEKLRHLPRLLVLSDEDKKPVPPYDIDLTTIETGQVSNDFFVKRTLKSRALGIAIVTAQNYLKIN